MTEFKSIFLKQENKVKIKYQQKRNKNIKEKLCKKLIESMTESDNEEVRALKKGNDKIK